MRPLQRRILVVLFVVALLAGITVASGAAARFRAARACCQLSMADAVEVTVAELAGWRRYTSEIGQDKWVQERVYPGENHGYFVDVGSGHGYIGSNTAALERRGWSGLCVDPFPVHMEGRSCRMFRDAVFSTSGRLLRFHTAGGLGGFGNTLAGWNVRAARAPVVELRTITLRDILDEAAAPHFLHFVSLDIEGAEVEALHGFPFERHRVGAWVIEHNREQPKRNQIVALLAAHGYRRVHSWKQDDYFVPAHMSY